MPELRVVGQKVMEIDGVTGYLIVNGEGEVILAEAIPDPENLANALALALLHANGLKQLVGMTQLRHMVMMSESSGDLLAINLDKYIIGILKVNHATTTEILRRFRDIFRKPSS